MYTLYIGDVLEQLDNIKSNSIDLIITDPPYGVLKNGKTGWGLGYKPANWDVFTTQAKFRAFTERWWELLRTKAKRDSFIFIFWSQKYMAMGQQIFNPDRTLIWRYNNLINNPKGDFAYDYEPIFVIKIGKPKLKKTSRAVLEYTKPQSNFKVDRAIYPTQKPRKLIEHLLDIVGLPEGSTVMDCFQGSGVVGEQSLLKGYNYIGMDESEDSIETSKKLLEPVEKKEGVTEKLLGETLDEVYQYSIFDYMDSTEIPQQPMSPIQATRQITKEKHYIHTKSADGKEHVYKRGTSGLWYDRDIRLLRKQLQERNEIIEKEEIK